MHFARGIVRHCNCTLLCECCIYRHSIAFMLISMYLIRACILVLNFVTLSSIQNRKHEIHRCSDFRISIGKNVRGCINYMLLTSNSPFQWVSQSICFANRTYSIGTPCSCRLCWYSLHFSIWWFLHFFLSVFVQSVFAFVWTYTQHMKSLSSSLTHAKYATSHLTKEHRITTQAHKHTIEYMFSTSWQASNQAITMLIHICLPCWVKQQSF